MPTVDNNLAARPSTAVTLPIDLRAVSDTIVQPGASTDVIRQVLTVGDPAAATRVARVVTGVAQGNENALAVALVPGAKDLQEIKELLFQILQQLIRNGQTLGAVPVTETVIDPQGVL